MIKILYTYEGIEKWQNTGTHFESRGCSNNTGARWSIELVGPKRSTGRRKSWLDIPVSRADGALEWPRKNPQGSLDAPFNRL